MHKTPNSRNSNLRSDLGKYACRCVFLGLCLAKVAANAANWGASAGYNNPGGSDLGVNLIYLGKPFGFEFGVGGLSGRTQEKSGRGGLWGDVDIKFFFAEKLRPYLEAGFATSLGGQAGEDSGVGFSAGSPFVGGGLLYQGSTVFGYAAADYRWSSKDWVIPVFGLGIQF